ncbi:MAG: alpha/beta fold hydrolase [Lachnospiraceae bacterium]|nr:alpha/beta fold hydrolase [Lachnospiraceae bacterium]
MSFGFSYVGAIWLALLFVPNLIWRKKRPKDYESYAIKENKVLLVFERAGQFLVTAVALIFSDFNYKGWNFWGILLLLSIICMLLYEIFWIRYFRSERTMQDFYTSFFGIPVAGATLPVAAFFLLGIYGGNMLMLLGSILLGIGHIGIHLQHRKEVCGPKAKRGLAVRILFICLQAVFCVVLAGICGTFLFFISFRNIRQISHGIRYRNGVNEQRFLRLTDQEEYVSMIGEDRDNPVIISLHGGPGSPTTFIDYCWQDELTDSYTLISWDERGCGRTYYHNRDKDPGNKTLSFETQLKDLDALVDYARERFGQKQVIILGHSYGSMLGSRYALRYPEKVSAFIGVGQCVNERNCYGEVYSYMDALKKARERGDDTTRMEAAYRRFASDMSIVNMLKLRRFVSHYHPKGVKKDVSTMAALTSPILGVDDIRWYLLQSGAAKGDMRYEKLARRPMDGYVMDFNALEYEDTYQMPVLLLSGSCDWVCPVDLVKEYAKQIRAPKVRLRLMKGLGHSPQGQKPKEFAKIIREFLAE